MDPLKPCQVSIRMIGGASSSNVDNPGGTWMKYTTIFRNEGEALAFIRREVDHFNKSQRDMQFPLRHQEQYLHDGIVNVTEVNNNKPRSASLFCVYRIENIDPEKIFETQDSAARKILSESFQQQSMFEEE